MTKSKHTIKHDSLVSEIRSTIHHIMDIHAGEDDTDPCGDAQRGRDAIVYIENGDYLDALKLLAHSDTDCRDGYMDATQILYSILNDMNIVIPSDCQFDIIDND